MERLRNKDDPTVGPSATDWSGWLKDVATSMTQGAPAWRTDQHHDPVADVTCEALEIALTAIHLDVAWHAGVMSAEAAMEDLNQKIIKTISRYTRSVALCQLGLRRSARRSLVE
jgi:hypothetical protein